MTKQAEIMTELTDIFNKNNRLRKPLMEKAFEGLSLSEIEALEIIGQIKQVNVTKLARALYMTRGAASKISKKLLAKGMIRDYSSAENKKEIYFELTPQGQAVNDQHEGLHKDFLAQDKVVFDELSPEEFKFLEKFLKDYNSHLDRLLKEGLA
ncbi:MarR family transcriptional regulator [Lactococcus termiticola]|uniref:MarR family transcriptional regulator n=1 Tax=Lactococcus termiticola TaxID=2169526 RepID=A0A2R5HE29_9LACT|nr:MarR family transcriptional regulator [Lactococcus termiticola]GBG96086.1 MarR family transcriptional regulator [Lactococcus termiticola]